MTLVLLVYRVCWKNCTSKLFYTQGWVAKLGFNILLFVYLLFILLFLQRFAKKHYFRMSGEKSSKEYVKWPYELIGICVDWNACFLLTITVLCALVFSMYVVASNLGGRRSFLLHPDVVTAGVSGWCRPADRESGEPEVAGGFLSPLLGVMAAVIFWEWIIHVATTRLPSPPRNVAPGLHVSLMPSPPRPLHNSAGTGEAAMCRRSRSLTPGTMQRRCGGGGEEGQMQWRWKMGRWRGGRV